MDQGPSEVEINLFDEEKGINYSIKLSPQDAARAQKDVMFATRLLELEIARKECDTANISAILEDGNDSTSDSTYKWSHNATLLLIEEFRFQENNLTSGKMTHKKVWNNIASALSTKGYCVTGSQCLSKYNGMKRTYKSIKDHNAKSGNNPRTWPYMSVMESLLGERPFMSPPAIASSSAIYISSDSEASNLSNAASDVDLSNLNPRKKRKIQESAPKISESIMESRILAEKNKDERHKEKMEFKKKMLGFMQKLLDKL
ncbi:uncharacterized protein LOC112465467 [Temnothorax curvispinosus]|uniref:Uncharacterized protein LOC112465467 n=1 Tax=Temnothorax curvispinosus TaxID=300111 RepID=A0A6J1R787_9HYME|nr:uncharacterized protein LOC112465467 [Temnothorax curvispinosus]